MLINNGNSINVLFSSTHNKMLVDHKLISIREPLYRFTRNNIIPWRMITLAVEMDAPLLMDHHFIEFLVVDNRSAYHGMLGRPTLKEL